MLRQDSDHLKSHISLTITMEIDFPFIFTVKEREKDTVTISDNDLTWPGIKVCIQSNTESDRCRSVVSYEGREERGWHLVDPVDPLLSVHNYCCHLYIVQRLTSQYQ